MLCKFILSPDEPSLSTCLVLGSGSTGIITMTQSLPSISPEPRAGEGNAPHGVLNAAPRHSLELRCSIFVPTQGLQNKYPCLLRAYLKSKCF